MGNSCHDRQGIHERPRSWEYQAFIARARPQEVLGYRMVVADIQDVLTGKTWAYLDETRRGSKRQKDFADIMRLIEAHPELEPVLPEKVRDALRRA